MPTPQTGRASVTRTAGVDWRADVEATYREARLEGADENKVTLTFVKELMETFKNQKAVHTRYAFEILLQMKTLLEATPTLMDIPVPEGTHFTVCGDVHGQVRQLCSLSLSPLPRTVAG